MLPEMSSDVDALGLAAIRQRRRRRTRATRPVKTSLRSRRSRYIGCENVRVVRGSAAEGAGAVKLHQLARILDRQQPQQHLIHQGEDGGVGADTQRQCQDDDDREGGRAGQRPDGVAEILDQCSHGTCRSRSDLRAR